MQKMKSENINEQEMNGSPMRPSREFQERMRQARLERMNRIYQQKKKESQS
jgi:hypothetical protein